MKFLKSLKGKTISSPPAPPEGLETLRVVRSTTARRVALRVDPARGQICLVIPKRASERKAWLFADQNREWIQQHLAEMETPVPFIDGAVIPIFGQERTIRIHRGTSRTTDIKLTATTLDVTTMREDPSANIKKFLCRLLEDTIRPMVDEKALHTQRRVPSITLRDTRARWGSCAPDGRMMFCWKLVFAPMIVVDYVVGHECAHLLHMNHSDRFWKLCRQLTLDMDDARDWLRQHGDRLLSYGLQT